MRICALPRPQLACLQNVQNSVLPRFPGLVTPKTVDNGSTENKALPKALKWGYQTRQHGFTSIGRESIGSDQRNACLQYPRTVAVAIEPRNSDWCQFLASKVPETCRGPALCNVGLRYTIHNGHPAHNVGVLLLFCNPSPLHWSSLVLVDGQTC